jgi:hypothetical protein
MALTDAEKGRARYHMGYPSQNSAASWQLGIPRVLQAQYLVELALNLVDNNNETYVRQIIGVMDGVECKLVDAQSRLAASQIGDLKLRGDEPDKLEREYCRWGLRLSDTLAAPVNPFSERYRVHFAGAGGVYNIPVAR